NELRLRQQLRVIAQHIVAAERSHAFVFTEEDVGEPTGIRRALRRDGKIVAADAPDQHERISAEAEELGRRPSGAVRSKEIRALHCEPCAHGRRIELLLRRTESGDFSSEELAQLALRRREACALFVTRETTEHTVRIAVCADLSSLGQPTRETLVMLR